MVHFSLACTVSRACSGNSAWHAATSSHCWRRAFPIPWCTLGRRGRRHCQYPVTSHGHRRHNARSRTELAAAAHIRVAERGTFYALPEGSRGFFVGGGASVRVPQL